MSISGVSRRIFGFGRRLARDECGAVLIYVSIAMTVFMGFAALIIDGGRLFALDTEMQSGADAIALAGAAELDGNTDAQDRADLAMANLVQNNQTFGTGADAITGFTRRFLSELPDDDQPLSDATVAPDQASTRFVEVTVTPRVIDTLFASVIGGDPTAGTTAVAVAGFTSAVCKFTPLFMCNPFEDSTTSLIDAINDPDQNLQRRLIVLRKGPGGGESAFSPGNFGFLQPLDGRGANGIKQSLGKVDPGACFAKNGVDLHTGAINSVHQAVNTRFDIYQGGGFGPNDADYPPAMNVTKGYLKQNPSSCSQEPYTGTDVPPTAMGFPADDCSTGGCESLGGEPDRLGNGDWAFGEYWDVNHGNRNGNITDDTYPSGTGWTDADPPSRYDVHRWEIDENQIPDNSDGIPAGEDGNPACSSATPTDDPDRRILYAAVINCGEHAEDMVGGSGDPIPAEAFVKLFITAPMTHETGSGGNDRDLLVEIVGVVELGVDDEVIHDIVQLYR